MAIPTVFRGAVLPSSWYNVVADLPFKLPPMVSAKTGFPIGPHDLASLVPMELVEQELGRERVVRIPREVRERYEGWRPTALVRARRLEQALGTPARLFYKYEGGSPSGSHEANTAVAQAYYAWRARAKYLVTAAADGQWAAAIAMAANQFGLGAKVYLVRSSVERRPRLKTIAEVWGAQVEVSPSRTTRAGKQALEQGGEDGGSLGLALSEALEEAIVHRDAKVGLGTLMNFVVLHQTVIGQEARRQMERLRVQPDVIVGTAGGGTSFGGLIAPFLPLRFAGQPVRFVAAEAAAVPSLTQGVYAYDYADAVGLSPLVKMYTLGHGYTPPSIEAGGMRYHGMSPLVSALYANGVIEAVAVSQRAALESAVLFARTESVLVAPETAYCLRAVVEEARRCAEDGQARTILFVVQAHGHFNLTAYESYLAEMVEDIPADVGRIRRALDELPQVREEEGGVVGRGG